MKFPVCMSKDLMEADINELELSVRSHNCLRRVGIQSVGDLVNRIEGKQDLLKIRNLGARSADEIMMNIFLFHYSMMKPEKRAAYVLRVQEMNR